MKNIRPIGLPFAALLCLPVLALPLRAQWTAPTPEELSMTSIPEVPNAPAVYLYTEQTTNDSLHMYSYYVRLKVLNEGGKDFANVELSYLKGNEGFTIDSVAGRTIHPDGTIVPFTGKPYDKLVSKAGHVQENAKVFTLPGVDVGSIIEYRYKLRYDDNLYYSPDWFVQSDLYVRRAHYSWKPTTRDLADENGDPLNGSIAYTPILPAGAKVQVVDKVGQPTEYVLDVSNVAPLPHEDYTLPTHSVSYRVLFYYTRFKTVQEFWTSRGKDWSKNIDKYASPGREVNEYVKTLVAPTDTQDQKARKLYADVMTLENTRFSRARTTIEEHAAGLKDVKSADDILKRKRGSDDQLTELFVAMARAAGLKAYVMGVAARNERIFLASYLSLHQLDDLIAIVNIDGKDVYFDPGQRYCEAEHLSWTHAIAGGLRQSDSGPQVANTPGEAMMSSQIKRIADLTLDEHGEASGTVTFSMTGNAALSWRQQALLGDDTSLKSDLRTHLEGLVPGGMEIKVTDIENLTDSNKPLLVKWDVKGAVGSSTGKRLLVPVNFFEASEKPMFTEPKRELAIDLHYARLQQDAVRFQLPPSFQVEFVPAPDKQVVEKVAGFETFSRRAPASVVTFRNVSLGQAVMPVANYESIRLFYGKLASKDQETLILTRGAPPAESSATKPTGN